MNKMKNHKRFAKKLFYGVLMAVFIYLIISLKVFTFKQWDIVFVYSICITTFMLSRVLGSFFYKPFSKSSRDEQKSGRFLFSSLTFPLPFKNLVKPNKSKFEPNVSFIIPCKNEEKSIYRTIESCVTVDYPKNKMEVIAINDGSTDNTLNEMLRAKKTFLNCRILVVNFKQNKGKRHGMEYGFRNALGEIV